MSLGSRTRVAIMHGVNLDQLGRRNPEHYGGLDFDGLERRIEAYAHERGLDARFFQTNHEGAFVEHLHGLEGMTDALILNPGAWTHYSWAIRDALELANVPAVEVHLSDVQQREEWRRHSVISELCLATISGRGAEGYADALTLLAERLATPQEGETGP